MRLILRTVSLMLVLILLCAACVTAAAAGYLRGDADGDDTISIMDATSVQRVLAGLNPDPDGMIALRGNVTGGTLNVLDATAIQRYLADIDNPYRVGERASNDEPPLPTEENQLPILRG